MTKFTKQQNARRYRLHRAVRRMGYAVNAWQRFVLVDQDQAVFPEKVMILKTDFQYKFQYKINI